MIRGQARSADLGERWTMSLGVPEYWTIPPQRYIRVPGQWETQANGTMWIDGQGPHN